MTVVKALHCISDQEYKHTCLFTCFFTTTILLGFYKVILKSHILLYLKHFLSNREVGGTDGKEDLTHYHLQKLQYCSAIGSNEFSESHKSISEIPMTHPLECLNSKQEK